MNLYDCRITREFLRQVAMLTVSAACDLPNKRQEKIADARLASVARRRRSA